MKDRIHSTYMYLAGSVGFTALSALAVARSPVLMNFMMRGSLVVSKLVFISLCQLKIKRSGDIWGY